MGIPTEDEIKRNAIKQLVKLADIMETCEPGSKEYKYYAKEYRAYVKVAYPEMYKKPRKQRVVKGL